MPLDNLLTRFPNGINNKFENDILANLKIPDNSGFHNFYEDFDKYTAAQWAVGGVNPVTAALANGEGGILSMATAGASADSNWLQQANTAWSFVAGKKLFFRARAQVDDATLAQFSLGLQIVVAGNNFLTPADGVFIRKPAADNQVYLVARVGSVETLSIALGTVVAATQFEVSFAYDGAGNIAAAFNGQVKASITPAAITAVALKVTAGVLAGSVAARTMLLDQLVCYKER